MTPVHDSHMTSQPPEPSGSSGMSSKYMDILDSNCCSKHPMYHIFLEISGQIQLNGGDSRHYNYHQEDQEPQECHPSTRMF